jgi:uncharacterized protein (DUF1778 family)
MARDWLMDRTLFTLSAEQTKAVLAELEDPACAAQDQETIDRLLAGPQPWDASAQTDFASD